jgi:hypothetical protein
MTDIRCTALVLCALAVISPAGASAAKNDTQTLTDDKRALDSPANSAIDRSDLALADSDKAKRLLAATIKAVDPSIDLNNPATYAVIHLVQYQFSRVIPNPESTDEDPKDVQQVSQQRWYLYQGGEENFSSGARFVGRRRLYEPKAVYVVWVHLDDRGEDEPQYAVSVNEKRPTNIAHLLEVLKLLKVGADVLPTTEPPRARDVWGYGRVDTREFSAADIAVTPQVKHCKAPKECVVESLGEAMTFDYERLQRWDAGIGVPIRRASQLSLDATTQTLTPKQVDRNTIYALVSVYPRKIDLRGTAAQLTPHLIFGLDATERLKPTRRMLVAAGWGPVFANFYVGAERVKLDEPSPEGKEHEWQLAFGVYIRGVGTLKKTGD